MKVNRFTFFLFIFLFLSVTLFSDIYIYIDKSGKRIISNILPLEYRKILKVIKTKRHFYRGSLSKTKYEEKINYYSKLYGVDPKLVKAIIKVESDFKEYAVSKKGAKGLMQLMEETAKEYGVSVNEIFNPDKNLSAGIKHLKKLIDKYGDIKLALAAYNAGETNVDEYGGIPPFNETINYVEKVLYYYKGTKVSAKNYVKKKKKKKKKKIKVYYDENGVLHLSNIDS